MYTMMHIIHQIIVLNFFATRTVSLIMTLYHGTKVYMAGTHILYVANALNIHSKIICVIIVRAASFIQYHCV